MRTRCAVWLLAFPMLVLAQEDVNGALSPNLKALSASDSGHILFTRFVEARLPGLPATPVSKIFCMTGDGQKTAAFIAPEDMTYVEQPYWSPDGSSVLFTSTFETARSAYLIDIFRADLLTGRVARLTGNEWSAGPVKGFGALRVIVVTGTAVNENYFKLIDPRNQIHVAVQGMGGQVFHPSVLAKNEQGQEMGGRWLCFVPRVPAGRIWVKCWFNKHIGALNSDVTVIEGETTDVVLSPADGNHMATTPSISPDGRYLVNLEGLAYFRNKEVNKVDVETQGYDTIGVRDLKQLRLPMTWDGSINGLAKDPRLSPDGKTIVFSHGMTPSESIALAPLESFLTGKPRGQVIVPGRNVVGSTGGCVQPAWSPDGKRIVFLYYTVQISPFGQAFAANLFVANADGTGLRQVTQVAANQCPMRPCWSPDGKKIAAALWSVQGRRFEMLDMLGLGIQTDIWTIDAEGGNPRQLTRDGRSTDPAWGL